jgi:hypothetical protein
VPRSKESVTERYGFTFTSVTGDNPVVKMFFEAHLKAWGYSPTTVPGATSWCAVVRGQGVYCVFGWTPIPTGEIDLTDFYVYPSRWGTLAAYAAIEKIMADAKRTGRPMVMLVPTLNKAMRNAITKATNVKTPDLLVYRWAPDAAEKEESA